MNLHSGSQNIRTNHNPSCFGIPGTMLTDIKVFGQSEVNVMNLISQDWSLDLDSSFIKSHLNQIAFNIIFMIALQHYETILCSSSTRKFAFQIFDNMLNIAQFRID